MRPAYLLVFLFLLVVVVLQLDGLRVQPFPKPSSNIFGIGLVGDGYPSEFEWAQDLAGDMGWILLIFAGIDKERQGPDQQWIQNVNNAYGRGLNVVLRLSPPWGHANIRDESDDENKTSYKSLALSYRRVVQPLLGLIPPGKNLYVQVHNEPNLCYEWYCGVPGQPLGYREIAKEYAHFLNDVIDALRDLKDDRLKIGNGALAPGGALECGCCGQENCGPADKPGAIGLDFLVAMNSSVPGIFDKVDFLASHPYPATNIGYGFNVEYSRALVGLKYFQNELETIKNPTMPVLITETGWASKHPVYPKCSEEQKAEWTVDAYKGVWLNDTRVYGVMPFMMMDSYWGDEIGFGYVSASGTRYPVFGSVKDARQSIIGNSPQSP